MSLRGAWSRVQALRQESVASDMMLLRAAQMACVPILLAYGSAGLVYGNLPLLTPFGVIDMPGACAWLTAAMAFALAVFAIDWLVRGELPPLPAPSKAVAQGWQPNKRVQRAIPSHVFAVPRPSWLRRACLGAAAVACASALVGRICFALGWPAFARPGGIAPQAEWPLYPLQWIWRATLPLARDHFVLGLIGVGVALFIAAQLMTWRKVRGAWFPFALVLPMLLTLNFLGSAGFDFAAARQLGGLNELELVAALAQNPGRYNVFTFLSLWTAIGFASVGMLLGFFFGRSKEMDDV